jgi:hypothetical protein
MTQLPQPRTVYFPGRAMKPAEGNSNRPLWNVPSAMKPPLKSQPIIKAWPRFVFGCVPTSDDFASGTKVTRSGHLYSAQTLPTQLRDVEPVGLLFDQAQHHKTLEDNGIGFEILAL